MNSIKSLILPLCQTLLAVAVIVSGMQTACLAELICSGDLDDGATRRGTFQITADADAVQTIYIYTDADADVGFRLKQSNEFVYQTLPGNTGAWSASIVPSPAGGPEPPAAWHRDVLRIDLYSPLASGLSQTWNLEFTAQPPPKELKLKVVGADGGGGATGLSDFSACLFAVACDGTSAIGGIYVATFELGSPTETIALTNIYTNADLSYRLQTGMSGFIDLPTVGTIDIVPGEKRAGLASNHTIRITHNPPIAATASETWQIEFAARQNDPVKLQLENSPYPLAISSIPQSAVFTDCPFPIASIEVVTGSPMVGSAVEFNGGSNPGAGAVYTWDFGDGTNSTEEDPFHTYNVAGTFTVTLTVSVGDVTGSRAVDVTVEANIPPSPVVEFRVVD